MKLHEDRLPGSRRLAVLAAQERAKARGKEAEVLAAQAAVASRGMGVAPDTLSGMAMLAKRQPTILEHRNQKVEEVLR
jgi:hypothetical protein